MQLRSLIIDSPCQPPRHYRRQTRDGSLSIPHERRRVRYDHVRLRDSTRFPENVR